MNDLFTVANISKAGMVGLLSIILVAFVTGMVVPGTTYTKMETDRDRWQSLAVDSLKTAKEVSRVRMPVMANRPVDPNHKTTVDEVRQQLELLKRVNKVNGVN